MDTLRELMQGQFLVPVGCLGSLFYHIRGGVNGFVMLSHRHLLVACDVRQVLDIAPSFFTLVSEQFAHILFCHFISNYTIQL